MAEEKPARKRTTRKAAEPTKKPAKKPPKAKGKPVPRKTAIETALRHIAILGDLSLGMKQVEVAKKYGITEPWLSKLKSDYSQAKRSEFANMDPVALALDVIDRLEEIERRFVALAIDGDSDSNKIGALRSLAETTLRRVDFLMALGKMPRDLGTLRIIMETRHTATVLVEIMDKYGMPDEAKREVQQRIRALAAQN